MITFMNGAELFVNELKKRDVPFIATLCGHGMNLLDKACRDLGLRLIDVRNEQAAGYMAEATGRLTRSVGVCAVSSGVAHANALTGVLNAYFDGAPMLLVTGCGPTETIGQDHFQDFDQIALAAPICKYARRIDRPERIPLDLHEAFSAALSGRPGPVHLTFPLDMQAATVNPDGLLMLPQTSDTIPAATDPRQISRIVDLLANAQRPLLIAGSGLYYARGESALANLIQTFPIPVTVPIWDRGTIPHPIETFMGVLGAATGGPRLLAESDLILMVGARCDYRVGHLQPPEISPDATIVRIDADPAELHQGIDTHLMVHGNPALVLDQLTKAVTDRGLVSPAAWIEKATDLRDTFRDRCRSTKSPSPNGRMHALDVIQAISEVLTEDTTLVIDGGNIGQWAHQLLCDRYPGHWLTCGASGVVGYGIPGAMAARALNPDRPVLLLSGDGALTFTVAELETAARQNLPFVALLADDEAWGITLSGHEQAWGEGITSELGPIRFDLMAEAFGARGIRIDQPEALVPALRDGFAADVPMLIHCPIVRSNPADV